MRRAEAKPASDFVSAAADRRSLILAELRHGSDFKDLDDRDVRILPGSFTGSTYRVSIGPRTLVVKQRDKRRTLFVTQTVTRLIARSGYPVQPIILPLRQVRDGWLLGLGWIEGVSLSRQALEPLSADERRQAGHDLVSWMRSVHRLTAPRCDWAAQADQRFRRKRDQALLLGVLTTADAATASRAWARMSPALAGVRPSLTHRDLHPANILLRGRRFLTVIDFENARIADPLYDLVKVQDFLLPLDHELAVGVVSALRLNSWDNQKWLRFQSVCALEYISAVVYHAKRGEEREVAERLASLLQTCEDATPVGMPLWMAR